MLNIKELLSGTLPHVRNDGNAYLKILDLEVGDRIDLLKSEIPPSYRTAVILANRIGSKYGRFYFVRKLEDKNGWRVIRVESLEVLKSLSKFRTKLHKMENEAPTKNHNFSDADLAQMIDQKIALATRDADDLIPRGVTALRLAALQEANNAFKIMPSDEELEGDVGIAVAAKNTARGKVESRIGNVRTMVQNIFGEDSPEYRAFGFKGMISLPDNELSRISKVVYKGAVKYQTPLLPEGCTTTFLEDMEDEVKAFDDRLDDVVAAEKLRLEGTGKRIKAGNTNYTEVDKICNTAKDVFRETDPIKHDEYLIYPTPSGQHVATRSGNLTPGQKVNINIEGIEATAESRVFIESKDTSLRFYTSAIPAGPETGGHADLTTNATADFAFTDFIAQRVYNDTNKFVNVENKGATNGKYRIRFTNLV